MPQITTLICTYRRPQLLARSLASLAAQTDRDFVVRIFDNVSGDETPKVVEWFRNKGLALEYHCHSRNVGVRANFDHALASDIQTPYFHFLNDDDYVLPKFYEIALDGFCLSPGAILSAARTAHVNETNLVLDVPLVGWQQLSFPAGLGASYMLEKGHPELTSTVFKTSWASESGGFQTKYGTSTDVPFEVLAAGRHPVIVSAELGGAYVIHDSQFSFKDDEADTFFGRFFRKMERSSFVDEVSYLATLRAATRRHLAIQRTGGHPASALRREWKALQALWRLCQDRPEHADQAIRAYGSSLVTFLRRRASQSRATEERNRRRDYFATMSAEIANVTAMLEKDYVQRCLADTGLKAVQLTARPPHASGNAAAERSLS